MDNISKHITYLEGIYTSVDIPNVPSNEVLESMRIVATKCFEPLREWYNKPIKINSFFRCSEVNKVVKGSKTSDHILGRAIDMNAGSKEENLKIFDWCKDNLTFDQLILEFDGTWIHISYRKDNNRKEILKINKCL